MKKSELLLNPYKEHLKKPYLHGAGTLEIDGVQYSADEYITMLEEENRKLKLHIEAKDKAYTALLKDYEEIKEDRKKILDEIEAEIERFKAFRNR